MTELATLIALADRTASEALALATVVNVSGSAYRRPGARMLVSASGQRAGMISGGCLEGDVTDRAMEVIASGHSMLVTYDSTSSEDIIFGLGLGCNGVVQVMLEPLPRDAEDGMLAFLTACHRERKPARMATIYTMRPPKEDACEGCPKPCNDCESGITSFNPVERVLHWPDGRVTSPVLRPAWRNALDTALAENGKRRIKTGTATLPAGDEADWLVETLVPPPALHLFGAGDDAIPVALLAQQLGWHVTVTDARAAFANRSRFPNVETVQSLRAEAFDTTAVTHALVIVMTHSYTQDQAWLRVLLPSAAQVISQIGPKARTAKLIEELSADGLVLTEAQLARLQSPAGLDLGAETPAEVALSLIAGLQAMVTQHRGGFLSERDGPIHQA